MGEDLQAPSMIDASSLGYRKYGPSTIVKLVLNP